MGGARHSRRRDGVRPPRRRGGSWGLLVLVLLVGFALLRDGTQTASGPPQPADAQAAADGRPAVSAPPPLQRSEPERVRIPSIRVDAPLTPVGLGGDGWIEAPPKRKKNLAGWFEDSVTPGERGTSVLVGHVDNDSGPVVFYDLGALAKGREIEVLRKDGFTAVFEIYGIEVFGKDDFPAERVYGDKGRAELRVLTCGGGYDEKSGYAGNVVVFARMTAVR